MADAEHRQPAKCLSHKRQKTERANKKLKAASAEYEASMVKYNSVKHILEKSQEAEAEVKANVDSGLLEDATVQDLMNLTPAWKLQHIIHVRKFTGNKFMASQLSGTSGKLNKVVYKGQTAQDIEANCSDDNRCLVYWAWKLC